MKTQTLILALVAATIVGGCQVVKDVGGNVAGSFQSSDKKFVQRTINEWVALAGAEIRWNEVPLVYQERKLNDFENFVRFLKDEKTSAPFQPYCSPRATSYPRSRRSITKQELYFVAAALSMVVAYCDADPNDEEYQLSYESFKWVLTRMRQAGLPVPAGVQTGLACGLDKDVQEYKQQNPGRSVDAEVLDWIKDNKLWGCRH